MPLGRGLVGQDARPTFTGILPLFNFDASRCGNAAAIDSHAYLAIVEKVAGAVGFYTEDGRQLGK